MLKLFRAAILLNALLLFLVQPMFAKMALPLLGGSPSVWTTCMLFFQAALLLGYLYSHLSIKALGIRRQCLVHALLVVSSMLLLPIGFGPDTSLPAAGAPTGSLLLVLAGSVGLPFFFLSTTAPLLQRWFAAGHEGSVVDPYRLYAASNLGSLGGLIVYPVLLEPFLSVPGQRFAWSIGYSGTTALIAACGIMTFRATRLHRESARFVTTDALVLSARARWIALAAVPSALMLAVTVHISTDIAAVPLLWIAPLALYLSTFIIVFSPMGSGVLPIARRALPLILLPVVLLLVAQATAHLWFVIPLHLAVFWLLSLLCHAELSRTRPEAAHLTEFYLWLAVGGMVGGIFTAFIAPRLFVEVGEYPVLLAVSALAIARPSDFVDLVRQSHLLVRPLLAGLVSIGVIWLAAKWSLEPGLLLPLLGLPALFCFSVSRHSASFAIGIALLLAAGSAAGKDAWGTVLYSERTFFGVYRVSTSADGRLTALFHGTTLHGSQRRQEDGTPPEPLAYYHRDSPLADVFAALERVKLQSVGVVGLGVGSLAAYAKEGQDWVFYEIDPAVERIARDSRYFTFLKSCGSSCKVLIGDGRLLVRNAEEKHNVLVLDAFSSDAIPIHLLTREAIDVYLDHLTVDGILVFHISNRHFDLRPVLGRAAASRGLAAIMRNDTDMHSYAPGALASRWVVMTRSATRIAGLSSSPRWMPLKDDGRAVWTDDFSNVWSALIWR